MLRDPNKSILEQLGPLGDDRTAYLRARRFTVVKETPPEGNPYLELGPLEDWFPATEIVFFRNDHSGRWGSGGHPTNSTLSQGDLVRIIEEFTSRGNFDEDYAIRNDTPIPIIVKDVTWYPVVKLLLEKYK